MPSPLHQAFVEVLREHPSLVMQLLAARGCAFVPPAGSLVADDSALGEAAAPELKADLLLRVEGRGHIPLVFVVEVQLRIDANKAFSWPSYVAGARARHKCDVVLLVVTPSKKSGRVGKQADLLGRAHGLRPACCRGT